MIVLELVLMVLSAVFFFALDRYAAACENV